MTMMVFWKLTSLSFKRSLETSKTLFCKGRKKGSSYFSWFTVFIFWKTREGAWKCTTNLFTKFARPDTKFQTVDEDGDCDLKIDEDEMKNLKCNVEHNNVQDRREKNIGSIIMVILEGPTSERDSQTVYYPCNLKHCWICCDCKFCKLTKLILCKNHKDHMKNCAIQENAQFQEHWINHVENFDETLTSRLISQFLPQ